MLINDHVHSRCSDDCTVPFPEMCRAAAQQMVLSICLTDHCDLMDGYGRPNDDFRWEAEDQELRAGRAAVPDMEIRRGVELGEAILRPEAAARILEEPDIDFVLGSMHTDRTGIDYYFMEYESAAQCRALLENYLQDLLELAGSGWYDSLAHLTYPLRYMHPKDGNVELHPLDDLVQEILKTLLFRGKALELNTSGWNQGRDPSPPEYVLKMYRQMGGELVTIGSDAHRPENIAEGLREGTELLKRCGFRYAAKYRRRNPQMEKI